jgi:hypothetical protein
MKGKRANMKFTTSLLVLSTALLALTAAGVPVRAASIPITCTFEGTGTVVGATDTTLTLEGDFAGSFVSGNSALNASWNRPHTLT